MSIYDNDDVAKADRESRRCCSESLYANSNLTSPSTRPVLIAQANGLQTGLKILGHGLYFYFYLYFVA